MQPAPQDACTHACMRAARQPTSSLRAELDVAAAAQPLEALPRPPSAAGCMSRQGAPAGGAAAAGSSGTLALLMPTLSCGVVGVALSRLIQQHGVPSAERLLALALAAWWPVSVLALLIAIVGPRFLVWARLGCGRTKRSPTTNPSLPSSLVGDFLSAHLSASNSSFSRRSCFSDSVSTAAPTPAVICARKVRVK